MSDGWIDANVILRHLTQDPPEQARRAGALFAAAQQGQLTLRVDTITVAECVWVLGSVYGHRPEQIAHALSDFVLAHGIAADDRDLLLGALDLYASYGVDFADALLAARAARTESAAVYSFDLDFDRLPGVRRIDPGRAADESVAPSA